MGRRLVVLLAWVLIAFAWSAVAWLDHLLRQAGRPDLVLFTPENVALILALLSAATVGAVLATRRPGHPVGLAPLGRRPPVGTGRSGDGIRQPHSERRYDPADAYAQSKLANLLFTHQLHARLEAAAAPTVALATHPGNARTGLWRTSSRLERALLSPRLRPLNS